MTREEFFMYLTIGLIVAAPIVARLYRRAMLKRTTRMLQDQLDSGRTGQPSSHASPPQGKTS
jgi:hypothetical protein